MPLVGLVGLWHPPPTCSGLNNYRRSSERWVVITSKAADVSQKLLDDNFWIDLKAVFYSKQETPERQHITEHFLLDGVRRVDGKRWLKASC